MGPRFGYRAEDAVAMLEATGSVVGYPRAMQVGHGSEFVSRDLDLRVYLQTIGAQASVAFLT